MRCSCMHTAPHSNLSNNELCNLDALTGQQVVGAPYMSTGGQRLPAGGCEAASAAAPITKSAMATVHDKVSTQETPFPWTMTTWCHLQGISTLILLLTIGIAAAGAGLIGSITVIMVHRVRLIDFLCRDRATHGVPMRCCRCCVLDAQWLLARLLRTSCACMRAPAPGSPGSPPRSYCSQMAHQFA